MSTEIIAVTDVFRVWFCFRLGFKWQKAQQSELQHKNVNFNCSSADLLSTRTKIIVALFS